MKEVIFNANPAFVETDEQISVWTGKPVSFKLPNGRMKIAKTEEQFNEYMEDGLEIVQTPTVPSRAGSKGKKRLTEAEADKIADANLAESLGVPSQITALGEGATVTATVITRIEQMSRRTGAAYPSTQVTATVKGKQVPPFCILYQKGDADGATVNLKVVSLPTDIARSGFGLERVA